MVKHNFMEIAVLGAGMVGRTIAIDLSKKHSVTSMDVSTANLDLIGSQWRIKKTHCDLTSCDYASLLSGYDCVVSAVPGWMGFRTLEAIIRAGKNVVDISFFPEDPFLLAKLAEEKSVTAIVDCGVAPGMSNMILGYWDTQMKVDDFLCLVGGLPKLRVKPFEYKAPFSPIDVIEEYTRPARYVENGCEVVKPALTDVEQFYFDKVGTLEAFNSDGLRTLISTMEHIPNMKEKTLRYPGHADFMRSIISAGLLDSKKIGEGPSPLVFNSNIIFNQWKLEPGEAEFTVMRIIIKGEGKQIAYSLFDENEKNETKFSSMSRTTGYACTAVVELFAQGHFNEKGIYAPESVGKKPGCFSFVLNYLSDRNVHYEMNETDAEK